MWQALYKAAKKRFDAEPEFKARAREAVTQLQSGDELFLQVRFSPQFPARIACLRCPVCACIPFVWRTRYQPAPHDGQNPAGVKDLGASCRSKPTFARVS